MKMRSEYYVTVASDGSWRVEYTRGTYFPLEEVASGKAEDQRRGEVQARCAIEDDKATRAKRAIQVSMTRSFTVKA